LQAAKTSVSDIRRQFMKDLEEESTNIFKFIRPTIITKPSETTEDLSAIERGELYHKLLELLDLSKVSSMADLTDEVTRLIQIGKLPADVLSGIDLEKIYQFWNSDVGRLFLLNGLNLRRELPFTVKIAEKDLKALPYFRHIQSLKDDFIILQGVVDLAMVSEKEIWILDYKTDRIVPEQIDERMREYLPQLNLYGFALTKIFKLPVTHKWIHFIFLNKTVELPLA
jgi:ATP-dependent helicase/nuclease subunit A